jgi:hypothetical protein
MGREHKTCVSVSDVKLRSCALRFAEEPLSNIVVGRQIGTAKEMVWHTCWIVHDEWHRPSAASVSLFTAIIKERREPIRAYV